MEDTKKKRVAIIGGGIFGVSSALTLAENFDVTIFEHGSDLMTMGTGRNQYRHHHGFHYPRSGETAQQCLDADNDFRSYWKDAIIDTIPSYYAIAKSGSKVSAEEYIEFCKSMGLEYTLEYPDEELLNRNAVGICLKTKEAVYDLSRMRALAREKLSKFPSIILRLEAEVIGGKFDSMTGEKILSIKKNNSTSEERFDYVINATYANHNAFRSWFGFGTLDIEFRLKELPIIALPTRDLAAVTIMDGPFVTIVPISQTGEYTLGDVPRSIVEVKNSEGGIPWSQEYIDSRPTRYEEMKEANSYFIPILKDAVYQYSMFSVLPVLPKTEATDARLTAVTNHGKGCWSVFEGKIITCVSAAKKIAEEIHRELYV